jgi:hypothetical protein
MTTSTANLIIAFDGTSLKVEMAGLNGSRQKIDGVSFSDLPFEIRAALTDRLDQIRTKEKELLLETQKNNFSYVAANHGLDLAKKVLGDSVEARFNKTWRLHQKGLAGNLTPATSTSTSTKEARLQKEIAKLDFDIKL